MPKIPLSLSSSGKKTLALIDWGLIGPFTGICPSLKMVATWLEKNLKPYIRDSMSHFFCDRGFFIFLFEHKEYRDHILWSGPYFLGEIRMYLNKWTSKFSPKNDVPFVVLMWVHILHLPLHCWSDDAFCCIGNSIGRYIDRDDPVDNIFSYAIICIDVDLEKWIPEAVFITFDNR
jgi:hypothetical protein